MKGPKMRSAPATYIFWKKSSYSAANGNCVEAAQLGGGHIAVRDSKNAALPALGFTPAAWRTFIREIKDNRQA
jgi:hypothetical protein